MKGAAGGALAQRNIKAGGGNGRRGGLPRGAGRQPGPGTLGLGTEALEQATATRSVAGSAAAQQRKPRSRAADAGVTWLATARARLHDWVTARPASWAGYETRRYMAGGRRGRGTRGRGSASTGGGGGGCGLVGCAAARTTQGVYAYMNKGRTRTGLVALGVLALSRSASAREGPTAWYWYEHRYGPWTRTCYCQRCCCC